MNTIATSAINIMALIILLRMVYNNSILLSQRRRPFCYGILLAMLAILAEIGTIVADGGGTELRSLNIISNVVGFVVTPFIPLVLLAILDSSIFTKRLYLLLPAVTNGVAAILSPFFGLLFYIDADNRYIRGYLFFLFVSVYMIHILFLVVFFLYKTQGYLHSFFRSIFGLLIFVIVGTGVQLFLPSVYSSWHCINKLLSYETVEGPQFEMYYGLARHENGYGEISIPVKKS